MFLLDKLFIKNSKIEDYSDYPDDLKKWCQNRDKYQPLWDSHFSNLEKIKALYSKAINLSNINNKYTEETIKLCLKDISMAEDLMFSCVTEAKINNQPIEDNIPMYPSFEILSKIYEKQGKYCEAINVCEKAINLGYLKDSTKGGLKSRIERLKRKLN